VAYDIDNLTDLRALSAYSVVEASRDLFQRSSDGAILSMCTLQTLVSFLPGLQAVQPLDVIFALLPVASDITRIATDYSKPTSEVYQQFVRYCTDTTMTLDIICTPWAPIPNMYSRSVDVKYSIDTGPWPTWICTVNNLPFGRRKKEVYGRRNGDVFVGHPNRRPYDAAHGSVASPVFGHASANGDIVLDGSMTISGLLIGAVEEVGNRAAAGTLHTEWIRMSGWNSGETFVHDNFWRTLVADRGPNMTPTPSWYHRACLYWLDFFEGEDVAYDVSHHRHHPSSAIQYMQRVQSVIWNRKLFTLHDKSGRKLFGLAPQQAKPGHSIAILHGCSVPVLLDRYKASWRLIGECFVYGIMEGEAMQIDEYLKQTQEFLLL
jgi:hypothetical protein